MQRYTRRANCVTVEVLLFQLILKGSVEYLVPKFVQPFLSEFFILSRKGSHRISPPLTAFLSFGLLAYMFLLKATQNKDSRKGMWELS